jgi:hypothetical protein
MIVWGGVRNPGQTYPNGAIYDPRNDTWSDLPAAGSPLNRESTAGIWTGREMIVWGGFRAGIGGLATGGRYDLASSTWTATPTGPSARMFPRAVWTGSEMVVWGGAGGGSSGLRYDPVGNAWSSTSQDGAPLGRYHHTLVWTGSEMIAWGGSPSSIPLDSGGGYCLACAPSAGTCDGVDHDCDGVVDLPVSPPAGVPVLTLGRSGLSWTEAPDATSYDVVRGGLAALESSGGDFSVATGGCLRDDATGSGVQDPESPPVDQAFWYLVRAGNCAGDGSYDSGATSQVASRDAAIAASGVACP